jgi:hypothetical protein
VSGRIHTNILSEIEVTLCKVDRENVKVCLSLSVIYLTWLRSINNEYALTICTYIGDADRSKWKM